jgi:hypothetical protein
MMDSYEKLSPVEMSSVTGGWSYTIIGIMYDGVNCFCDLQADITGVIRCDVPSPASYCETYLACCPKENDN